MIKLTWKQAKADVLRRQLEAVPAAVKKTVETALMESGREVADQAKKLVAVSTRGSRGNPAGTLRDSIHSDWVDGRKNAVQVGASRAVLKAKKVPTNLPRWIEKGTSAYAAGETHRYTLGPRGKAVTRRRGTKTAAGHPGMRTRPWLLPAWNMKKRSVRKRVGTAVNQALASQARKNRST